VADRSDIVVVGGGVLGTMLALHLAEAGAGTVRLIERDGLFEGTSAAGAGFIAVWAALAGTASSEEAAVQRYGLDFYRRLHEEEDGQFGYRRSGLLTVTYRSGDAAERTDGTVQASSDPAEPGDRPVDPAEAERLTGGTVRADHVVSGHWHPSGAQVHVPSLAPVLARRLLALGVAVDTRRPVTGIVVRGDRVVGVATPTGTVECGIVVLATGAWSNRLLRPLGLFLPSAPQLTSRFTTGPLGIPANLPALILESDSPGEGTMLWVREHEGGLVWGGPYPGYPRDLLVDSDVPDRFDELPLDGVEDLKQASARVSACLPALSRPTSIRLKHGAPCYTPDMRALVGPVPGAAGLYALTGDNELGVTHAPGFARVMVDLLTGGHGGPASPEAWAPERFAAGPTREADVIAGTEALYDELTDTGPAPA